MVLSWGQVIFCLVACIEHVDTFDGLYYHMGCLKIRAVENPAALSWQICWFVFFRCGRSLLFETHAVQGEISLRIGLGYRKMAKVCHGKRYFTKVCQHGTKKTESWIFPWDLWTLKPQKTIWNCLWTKSCTTKDDDYRTIYRVLTIPGGAGFLPSTEGLQ